MRGSAVRCATCSGNSTPGRVVTAVLKPSSAAMRELARARRGAVADRIAEMRRPLAERGLDHGGALAHLAAHRRVGRLAQHHVIDRVRPDGRERIGGELVDLGPGHAQLVAAAPHRRRRSARRGRAPRGADRPRCRGRAATSRCARRARIWLPCCRNRSAGPRRPSPARCGWLRAIACSSVSHHSSPKPSGKLVGM